MKTKTIDRVAVQTLADNLICKSHITAFDTDAPRTDAAPDPVVRKKLTEFLSAELNDLLKAA
jgi:hypothetical protein